MLSRPKRRTRGRRVVARSPLAGSLRLFCLLLVLVGINIYVFFYHGTTSLKAVFQAASLPPSRPIKSLEKQGLSLPSAEGTLRGRKGSAAETPGSLPVGEERLLTAVLAPKDTLSSRLQKMGVPRKEAEAAIAALREKADPARLLPGTPVRARLAGTRLRGLELDVSPMATWRISRDEEGRFTFENVSQEVETRLAEVGGTVGSSLYEAVHSAAERTSLVAALVDIFAHDINFYVDTHPGDTFRVIVEKHLKDGEFLRYGRVLAAEYSGKVGTFRAFAFTAPGVSGYYDERGQNCAKVLLKAPLKFSRLTSRFDLRRMHPVLHVERGHYGVDYGAPVGTPVWASATGKVVFLGNKPGSGNTLILAHAGGMRTHYYHLSRFAKGLKQGALVRQKQVIGYVGSTGLSTGPHLHFAVSLGGSFVDPLTMKVPREPPLPPRYREAFERAIAPLAAALPRIPVSPPNAAAPKPGQPQLGRQ